MSYAKTFDAVNARAIAIGQKLVINAVVRRDLDTLRLIRDESIRMYDSVVEMIDNKYGYAEWHKMFLQANASSVYHKLDPTGEFTKLVEELAGIDAEGYYFAVITPIILAGPSVVTAERSLIMDIIDTMINKVIRARREEIYVVN